VENLEEMKFSAKQFISHKTGNLYDCYRVGKRIGDGAFGTVSIAVHRQTNVKRAIKTVKKAGIHKTVADRQRFYQEVDILKTMDHPNILKLYEVFEDERYIHLITEICNGGELFDYILEKK
jgi:calcium-dependent protein kinase